MDYQEVKVKLVESKQLLEKKLQNQSLSIEEKETLRHSIDNLDYIIELTDMNHFERGLVL